MKLLPLFLVPSIALVLAAPSPLAALRPHLSSPNVLVLPGDEDFTNATARWSDWRNPSIAAVVEAANANDIEASTSFAVKHNIPFLVRATGHGWTDFTSLQKALLIRLPPGKIDVNTKANTVTVGPAHTVKELVDALAPLGKQIPAGACNCAGILGVTLGGGHGRLQGEYGLMADNILSASLLLANGTVVSVSATSNSDLFWALRGAGHNFGVVLEATYRIYDMPKDSENWYDGELYLEGSAVEDVFEALNNWKHPKEATVYASFIFDTVSQKPLIQIHFAYAGSHATGAAALKSLFGPVLAAHPAVRTTSDSYTWQELNGKAAGGLFDAFCTPGGNKNTFNSNVKVYSPKTMVVIWKKFAAFVAKYPQFRGSAIMGETYPLQGMQAVDPKSTAYPGRDVAHIILPLLLYTDSADDDTANAFGFEIRSLLQKSNGFEDRKARVYLNYARGDEALGDMYGHESWRQKRLSALKRKYDPEERFSEYHGIPLNIY